MIVFEGIHAVYSWYNASKWAGSLAPLPKALISLAERTTTFFQERFQEYFQDTSKPSYDVEAGSKRTVREIARLRRTSANFDTFIEAHPALKSVVDAHLKKHGHQIVWMDTEEYVPSPTDTVFDKWRKLQDEKAALEFMWKERIDFVKKHPPVMECMLEHMSLHAPKPVQIKNE